MKDIMTFLSRIVANNNREWFHSHKDEYAIVKQKTEMLASQLINLISRIDSEAARLQPSDCTYRIYRDTRFSQDKTPYKKHIGVFVNPPDGKKSLTCGYYFHLEPGKSLVAAGTVCLPSKIVGAIRRSIYDEIDEYRSIVEDERFRALLPNLGDNKLKTAPMGIDRNWEFVDYVRPRDFLAWKDVDDSFFEVFDLSSPVPSDATEKVIMPYLKQMQRFNRFINFTIEDFI
ncbi:MAG: DUF2461 domain-containing protein [Prevotella sp.]|nr:DUF2461 domain-containing protein [Bacteroides sp.]MCM1366029.1 DUF2461 domain-containing protein [Prevotella sp.]MCM1436901.1 DUF2461 domain-containing protein [Prevotella sp.]